MAPRRFDLGLVVTLLSFIFIPTGAQTTGTGTGTGTGTNSGSGSSTLPGSTTSVFTTNIPVPTTSSSSPGPPGTVVPTPGPTSTLTSSTSSSTTTQSPTTTGSSSISTVVLTAYATVTRVKYSTISASYGPPTAFPPAVPVGCYYEGQNGRALPDFFFEDDVLMTIDMCVGLCPNYTFLGLEYGTQCWCSNSIQNGAFPVDNAQCDTVCAGNAQQICGSSNALSVFLPPPPPPQRPKNNITFTSAGCYTEPTDGSRALKKSRTAAPDMTPASCFNICGLSGFLYAGLEYGEECWCGNKISTAATLVDPSRCNMNCAGDANQTCGGPEVLSLYNGTFNPSSVAGLLPYAPIWDRLLRGKV